MTQQTASLRPADLDELILIGLRVRLPDDALPGTDDYEALEHFVGYGDFHFQDPDSGSEPVVWTFPLNMGREDREAAHLRARAEKHGCTVDEDPVYVVQITPTDYTDAKYDGETDPRDHYGREVDCGTFAVAHFEDREDAEAFIRAAFTR